MIAGRFELREPIASGASGTVWRAIDRRLGRECAAKVLQQRDSATLLRFVREQGVRLEHPHLATPYGWAAEDHDVAIAMPLVRGGTLESALADHGALSPELTATLLLQLLEALMHVHRAGWLHRDVKPANVLLEATGTGRPHLRLSDFGTAMRTSDPRFTELGFVHGTPGYLPPEAYDRAAPSFDFDLYAAGVIGIRMLHPTATSRAALARARSEVATSAPAPLSRTILGLTSEDPEARREAALAAHQLLSPVANAHRYLTAAGEPFEVFDQLGNPPLTHRITERLPDRSAPSSRTPLWVMAAGAGLLVIALLVWLL